MSYIKTATTWPSSSLIVVFISTCLTSTTCLDVVAISTSSYHDDAISHHHIIDDLASTKYTMMFKSDDDVLCLNAIGKSPSSIISDEGLQEDHPRRRLAITEDEGDENTMLTSTKPSPRTPPNTHTLFSESSTKCVNIKSGLLFFQAKNTFVFCSQ